MPTESQPVTSTRQPPLVSTGMSKGFHSRAAVVLAIIGFVLWFAIPAWSNYAPSVLFLACAIGLIGEALCIFRLGEVSARKSKSPQFIVIRRATTPARFYFYVGVYALLGIFGLVLFIFTVLSFLLKHAA